MTRPGASVHTGAPVWTLGVDLGRRAEHEAILRAPDGSEAKLRFPHTRAGIDGLIATLGESVADAPLTVVIEPTATRWQALAEQLSGQGIEVRQVHAATVARLRAASDITGAKSDRLDARTLAGAAGYSHEVVPNPPAAACAHALCLERLRLRRERRRLRSAVHACLDTVWPEFFETFAAGEKGVTARAVMAVTGGDPARARRLGARELERRARQAKPGRRLRTKKIQRLVGKTENPVGYRAARRAYIARLGRLLRRRALVEAQLEAVEAELVRLLPRLPGAERIQSLPGLTDLKRAVLLAAAGDVRRLGSGRALAKLGGTVPVARDSGESHPKRKISARCRHELRDAAYQAARGLVRACPAFRALYRSLLARLAPRQAIIACANRLLRVLWRLVTGDVDYDSSRVAPGLMR